MQEAPPHVIARSTLTSLRGAKRRGNLHHHIIPRNNHSHHYMPPHIITRNTPTSQLGAKPHTSVRGAKTPTSQRGAPSHVIARSKATWQSFTPISDPTIGPDPCLSGPVEQTSCSAMPSIAHTPGPLMCVFENAAASYYALTEIKYKHVVIHARSIDFDIFLNFAKGF